jgi:hypothetical protein
MSFIPFAPLRIADFGKKKTNQAATDAKQRPGFQTRKTGKTKKEIEADFLIETRSLPLSLAVTLTALP